MIQNTYTCLFGFRNNNNNYYYYSKNTSSLILLYYCLIFKSFKWYYGHKVKLCCVHKALSFFLTVTSAVLQYVPVVHLSFCIHISSIAYIMVLWF